MINDAAHFECNKALDSVGGSGTPIPYLDITAHLVTINKIKQQFL